MKNDLYLDQNNQGDDNYQLQMKKPTESMMQLVNVPIEFRDHEEYFRIWNNLFEVECLSQFKVENEVEETEILQIKQEGGFNTISIASKREWLYMDLMAISVSGVQSQMVGIVEQIFPNRLEVKVSLKNQVYESNKLELLEKLKKGVKVNVAKIGNINTQSREYIAISGIEGIRLKEYILNPGKFMKENTDRFIIK